jgi:hypothetical protein
MNAKPHNGVRRWRQRGLTRFGGVRQQAAPGRKDEGRWTRQTRRGAGRFSVSSGIAAVVNRSSCVRRAEDG